MSRASRRYRRWERRAREEAAEDARRLALDLYEARPGPVNPYRMGVALESGEVLYRELWARYSTLAPATDILDGDRRVLPGPTRWRDWGWSDTLITSHRLVTRLAGDGGRFISNWWTSLAGVQVDLARDMVVLDDRTSEWRGAYAGPAAAVVAVAAIERFYGPAALVDHPGLAPLRQLHTRVGRPGSTPSPGPFVLTGRNN